MIARANVRTVHVIQDAFYTMTLCKQGLPEVRVTLRDPRKLSLVASAIIGTRQGLLHWF